jgi:hypothetical protein
MGKFRNFFKPQPKPVEQGQPEVETAVVLVQYENGGSTVGYLNVGGVKCNRQATLNDMYRMVCEVKAQIENIRVCDRIQNMFSQPSPTPPPAPIPPIPPVTENKEEKTNEENAAGDTKTPEEPERPA